MFNECLYIIWNKTQLNFTSNFQTKITPNLNISARMIIDLYKKLEVVYHQ